MHKITIIKSLERRIPPLGIFYPTAFLILGYLNSGIGTLLGRCASVFVRYELKLPWILTECPCLLNLATPFFRNRQCLSDLLGAGSHGNAVSASL